MIFNVIRSYFVFLEGGAIFVDSSKIFVKRSNFTKSQVGSFKEDGCTSGNLVIQCNCNRIFQSILLI